MLDADVHCAMHMTTARTRFYIGHSTTSIFFIRADGTPTTGGIKKQLVAAQSRG